jgi:cold shock CspA family protein
MGRSGGRVKKARVREETASPRPKRRSTMRGRVTIAESGYAWIDSFENGAEYFVEPRDIKSGSTLAKDQIVEFEVEFVSPRGTKATNVRPVQP